MEEKQYVQSIIMNTRQGDKNFCFSYLP